LDTWTPEQVVSLQQMGNSRARAVYEANLPDNFRRPQNDSSLESFIRAKYEHKKYIAREWVPPTLPKVNWEKEIDEEIEKQKRKKKTVVEKKPLANVEVPQLPKPKNPSPKPGRVTNPPETKKDNDLLGLQNGEDSFSGFLSAPSATEEAKKEEEKSAKSEEESFFNQIAPTEKEKVKLTKDSILALYSNTPANNFNQFQSQMPYQGNFPPQNFQSFGGYPQQQTFPVAQPGGQFAQWAGQSQFPVQGQMPATQVGQFPNQYQNGPSQQFGNFQSNGQFPATQFGQFQQSFNAAQTPNPFFANQNGLQQQFSNLSLNNPPAANAAPTLATNIWQ
jgi:stromal membrane-associated protein